MKRLLGLKLLLFVLTITVAQAAEDLTVLTPRTNPADAFERWLLGEFNRLCDRRTASFDRMLKSEVACKKWQQDRRAFFLDRIGGLPERTPLNPKVTGTLQGDGYRVEKIVLETRPLFHLTANLYLPATPPPWPAVLVACGHSHDGKAVGQYQLISRLLARHGMAAMCYDPIGQGERYQTLDVAKEHSVFEDAPHVKVPHPNARLVCTTEHTLTAISSALIGSNTAQFRIWDGMRVIDYLQSRPDIMPDKIGCTGNSGGGTETAYLMALDDRIVAAAPGCYLTSFKKLIETKGPQDGEQNIFGQIDFGMDEADYCIMRAPKPTLICAGVRDATFDFSGTMEVFGEAKRFYSRLGFPEHLDIAAPDAPHGFTLQLREAVTRFMSRWLLGKDEVVRELAKLPDVFSDDQLREFSKPDWTAEQLQCTPRGQVLLMRGERSVYQINAEAAVELKRRRSGSLQPEMVCEVSGASEKIEVPRVDRIGEIRGDGFRVEKVAMRMENAFQLPGLLYVPENSNGRVSLFLSGSSMKDEAESVVALVKSGIQVLSAELRGIGETETGQRRRAFGAGRFGRDNLEILTAYLMGRSYVGMRIDDVRSWAAYLRSRVPAGGKIDVVASGEAAIPALHAAALEPGLFGEITLRRMIESYETIVGADETMDQTVNVIHGVLRHYDLPDLIERVGKERVKVDEAVDGMGRVRAASK